MECIDLRARFGRRYRVAREGSGGGDSRDPWYRVIRCRNGHIYPHGGEMLGAATNRRGHFARKFAAIPGVEVVQDGDDGLNAIFPVELFSEVAKVMRPRRRRQLSASHRAKLVEAGRRHQFSSGSEDEKTNDLRAPASGSDSEAA